MFWGVTSCRVMELFVNIYQSTGRNIREHSNTNQYLARTASLLRYITFALSIHNFCELRSFLTNCCEVKRLSVGQRTAVTEPRPTAHFPLSHSSAPLPPGTFTNILVKQKADYYAATLWLYKTRPTRRCKHTADASKWYVSARFSDWPECVKFWLASAYLTWPFYFILGQIMR